MPVQQCVTHIRQTSMHSFHLLSLAGLGLAASIRRDDSGFTYSGCYSDSQGSRSLTNGGYSGPDVTPTTCVSYCSNKGFNYAGLEYGNECWCGYVLQPSAVKKAETDCSMTCAGSTSGQDVCGNGDRLSIYWNGISPSANPGVSGYSLAGCYNDTNDASKRALSVQLDLSTASVAGCVSACSASSYAYAGLENGNECWCDTKLRNNALLAPTRCTTPCAGNASEYCGSAGYIQVYNGSSTVTPAKAGPVPTGWSSLGCYNDKADARTINQRQEVLGGPSNMTIGNCLSACQAAGYPFAGLEFAKECYCGGSIQGGCSKEQAMCNQPCQGNAAETCGGADRMNVYALNYSPSGATCAAPPLGPPKLIDNGSFEDKARVLNGWTPSGDVLVWINDASARMGVNYMYVLRYWRKCA